MPGTWVEPALPESADSGVKNLFFKRFAVWCGFVTALVVMPAPVVEAVDWRSENNNIPLVSQDLSLKIPLLAYSEPHLLLRSLPREACREDEKEEEWVSLPLFT